MVHMVTVRASLLNYHVRKKLIFTTNIILRKPYQNFVLFHFAIVLSVLLRYTDSDCPFGIFKLFLVKSKRTNIWTHDHGFLVILNTCHPVTEMNFFGGFQIGCVHTCILIYSLIYLRPDVSLKGGHIFWKWWYIDFLPFHSFLSLLNFKHIL